MAAPGRDGRLVEADEMMKFASAVIVDNGGLARRRALPHPIL